MNKKFMYAALALPMMFAACQQEELFNESNVNLTTPDAKGYKIDLVTAKGDVADVTRATWNESTAQLGWELTDKISVFWLADQDGEFSLNGNFNSVYKTEDGSNFSSESLIYEGGNVAVFPANLTHTSAKTINIAVSATQGENPEKNTPYISNRLNIDDEHWAKNKAGYQEALYAPMKQAANVVFFDFTLDNTAELVKSYDFAVKSVSLVASKAAFAETAVIKAGQRATVDKDGKLTSTMTDAPASMGTEKKTVDKKEISYNAVDKVLEVYAKPLKNALTSTHVEVVDVEQGKYRVKFVVLPTEVETFAAASEIVIETNCGRINLQTKEQSADKKSWNAVATFQQKPDGDAGKDWVAPAFTGGIYNTKTEKYMTIAQMVEQIVSYRRNETKATFLGEKVGRTYMLSFSADMKNATLNDSRVYSSTEIETYVNIYKAMHSVENMNLILSTTGTDASKHELTFPLTKAAVDAVNSCNTYGDKPSVKVTLSISTADNTDVEVDGVVLTGGGNVYLDNAKAAMFVDAFNLELDNSAAWTMNDTYSNEKVQKITNNGTLTVSGTTNKDGDMQQLTTPVVNNGTFNIGGEFLRVSDKLTNNKTVKVANLQDLRFNASTTVGGSIEVASGAFLTVEKDITLTSSATIENSGIVASIAGTGGIVNNGTINVKADNAITYVQDNTNGTINLKNRDDEVKVQLGKGTIVYNYTSGDDSEFEYNTEDKFTKVVFGTETSELILNADFSEIDMVFNGSTTLSAASGAAIRDLTVGKGAHLMFLTPSGLYSNVLNVEDIVNNGNITIGGTIIYSGSYDATKGVVRSVGSGAIVEYGH